MTKSTMTRYLALLFLAAVMSQHHVAAFAPNVFFAEVKTSSSSSAIAMAEEEGGALVAVNQESIEFSAGTIGAAGGFLLGGPVLGAITGVTTNYLARKNIDTASEVVKGVAEKGIGAYNYVGKLLVDNDVVGKAKEALGKSNPEALDKVESTWKTVSTKAEEIGVKDIAVRGLGVAGDAMEKLVDTALGAAEEYGVADKVKAASSEAMDKAKKAADQAVATK